MSSIDHLDSAAVHVLRRLLRGERVDAAPFSSVPMLCDSRAQLLRGGYVVEHVKGKSSTFGITALGKALAPAIARADADVAEQMAKDQQTAAEAGRARAMGPALLKSLRDLIAACTDPDLSSANDDAYTAAYQRHDAAIDAARDAVRQVEGYTCNDART